VTEPSKDEDSQEQENSELPGPESSGRPWLDNLPIPEHLRLNEGYYERMRAEREARQNKATPADNTTEPETGENVDLPEEDRATDDGWPKHILRPRLYSDELAWDTGFWEIALLGREPEGYIETCQASHYVRCAWNYKEYCEYEQRYLDYYGEDGSDVLAWIRQTRTFRGKLMRRELKNYDRWCKDMAKYRPKKKEAEKPKRPLSRNKKRAMLKQPCTFNVEEGRDLKKRLKNLNESQYWGLDEIQGN
jgi:hypothetical protein